MSTVLRLTEYQLRDVLRSRSALVYAAFVLIATDLLLRFSATSQAALLALGSVVILLVPLVTFVFAALYMYAARPFHELLLTQPITRGALFAGTYFGVVIPLVLALGLGLAAPLVWHVAGAAALRQGALLFGIGATLTLVCAGAALLVGAAVGDRMKGMVVVLAVWLVLALLYDAIVLLVTAVLSDYPLERPLILLMLLNPLDLARVQLLVEYDAAALMGHTGAVLRHVVGDTGGRVVGAAALGVWVALPPMIAWRVFARRDF